MKPACMKNTRNAAISVHIVLIGLMYAGCGGAAASAKARVAKYHSMPLMPATSSIAAIIFPPSSAMKIRRVLPSRKWFVV